MVIKLLTLCLATVVLCARASAPENITIASSHNKEAVNVTLVFKDGQKPAQGDWVGIFEVAGEYEYEYETDDGGDHQCAGCWVNTFEDSISLNGDGSLWTFVGEPNAQGIVKISFEVDYAGDFQLVYFEQSTQVATGEFSVSFPDYPIIRMVADPTSPTVEVEINLPLKGNASLYPVYGGDWFNVLSGEVFQNLSYWEEHHPKGGTGSDDLKATVALYDTCWGYGAALQRGGVYACHYGAENKPITFYASITPSDYWRAGYHRFFLTFGSGGPYAISVFGNDGWDSWGLVATANVCDVQISPIKDYSTVTAGEVWEAKVEIGENCKDGLTASEIPMTFDVGTAIKNYDMCGWGIDTDISFSVLGAESDAIKLALPKVGEFSLQALDHESRVAFGDTQSISVIAGNADPLTSSFSLPSGVSASNLEPIKEYVATFKWVDRYHNLANPPAEYGFSIVPVGGDAKQNVSATLLKSKSKSQASQFSFNLPRAGLYELHVKIGTTHITGSPFTVNLVGRGNCIPSDYELHLSSCSPESLVRTLSMHLAKGKDCIEHEKYPNSSVPCEYVPEGSRVATIAWATGFVAILIYLAISLWLFTNRKYRRVRFVQYRLIIGFATASCLFALSPIMYIGPATDSVCLIRLWWLHLSIILCLATLFSRVYRVWVVVHLGAKNLKKVKLTESDLAKQIAFLTMIGLTILIVATLFAPPEKYPVDATISGFFATVTTYECKSSSNIFGVLLAAYELTLVAFGVYLAYQTRTCPPEVCETSSLILGIYNLCFIGSATILLVEVAGMGISARGFVHAVGSLLAGSGTLILLVFTTFMKVRSGAVDVTVSQVARGKYGNTVNTANTTQLESSVGDATACESSVGDATA